MKTTDIIIYHADCADGMAAAWVAREAILRKRPCTDLKLLPMSYKQVFDYDLLFNATADEVHLSILDFSLPLIDLIELYDECKFQSLTYIDHHPTGQILLTDAEQRFKDLIPEVNCIFRTGPGVSGCSIAWNHYFPDLPMPNGILRIADRDTWTFSYDDSKFFHTFAANFLTMPYMWNEVFDDSKFDRWVDAGKNIRLYINNLVNKYADKEKWKRIEYNGLPGAVLNINRELVSDVSSKILDLNSDIKFVICFQVLPEKIKFDFRSRANEGVFNCGGTAAMFGGGGHVGSAGVEVEKSSREFHFICSTFGIYFN